MEFPRYENAVKLGIDIETKDMSLSEGRGMGATKPGNFICGVAVGAEFADGTRHAIYLPVKHEGGGNLPREQVWRYLNDTLSNSHQPKVGTNLQYDLAYLWSEGVRVQGPFHDITVAQPLLDENQRSYSLESQAMARLGRGKSDAAMEAYIREKFGVKPGREKESIWRCPAEVVAPYAIDDVLLPLEIIGQQIPELEADEMADLWQMESDLLPILVRMHLNGVRVNLPYAQQLHKEWGDMIREVQQINAGVNANSSKQIAAELDRLGIAYPRTALGNPKLGKKVLEGLVAQAPFLQTLMDEKKLIKFRSTFIESYILNSHVCGRIHGQFNQLKGDEYGTVTGRLCVGKDTRVLTQRGPVRIVQVHRGDKALTHKGNWKDISALIYKGQEEMFKVTLEDGRNVTCTKEHRFLTAGGWKHLSQLAQGDEVLTVENVYYLQQHQESGSDTGSRAPGVACAGSSHTQGKRIISIESVGVDDVWDITVEDDHSYVAEGIVHHNSASNPNLQNIPNPERDPVYSPKIRGMYLPEQGQEWLRFDFSQIEYRLLVHFASLLPGGVADVVRAMFIENPDIDFHEMCAQLTGLSRKQAKNINFGLVYGMGIPALAAALGLTVRQAEPIFAEYHDKAPFAKAFMEAAMKRAQNRGFVRTLARRKRRFETWEPSRYISKADREQMTANDPNIRFVYDDKQQALADWGAIKRAHTHAAANAVLQGSSADITKRSMVEGYKRGIYDVLGFPLVTVHDELGFSWDPGNKVHREAAREMEEIMINAYQLQVPVRVGRETGANWGACESFNWEPAE